MLLLNPFLRRTASRSATSGRARAWTRDRLTAESLEVRNLLSATWPGLLDPQSEAEPNDTLDLAQHVGNVGGGVEAEFVGTIGESESPSDSTTDVDWYSFTLVFTGRVQLTSLPGAGGATTPVVLTLYGDQLAEFDASLPLQRQLLGRQEGRADGSFQPVDLRLNAGTYFVAVSGAGNRFFHPFVADSGIPGQATDYGVRISLTSGRAPSGNHDQFAPPAESGLLGNDTPETASDLGDLTTIERLQVSGRIGDDHFYNYASEDPFAMNPASDVDLYRFSIMGDGSFALIAETFAGRLGSPLDPALTLYRADDAGSLQFVATNNNSLNPAESTNGFIPFFSDAVLFAGLSAGDYFLAVSSSGNDAESGPDGVFDPQVSHSGLNGGSVGNYVLDLTVYADNVAPQIVGQVFNLPGVAEVVRLQPPNSHEFGYDANLLHAPTHLHVQFSEPVNLQQLAYQAYVSVGTSTVSAVFIEGTDGTRYIPRLESYDSVTETAHFLMLDGLPNGDFELHVSGGLGLTDGAGNLLVGNDASGDFITRFTVADASHDGNLEVRLNATGNDSFATAQDLGVLFPHELQAGLTLVRNATTNAGQPADAADFYRFELLQTKSYFFSLSDLGDGAPPVIEVLNEAGQVMPLVSLPGGQGLLGFLPAGKYVLHLGSWDSAESSNVTYQVEIELGGASENPTPLTSGAAPAVGIHLVGQTPDFIGLPVPAIAVAPTHFASTTPTGLNDSLATLPMGLPANSTFAVVNTPSDSHIVRLFGFGDRDRLFSMIDSNLSRPAAVPWSVTKAELSESELQDILELNRTDSDEIESEDAETTPSSAETNNEPMPGSSLDAAGEVETSATDETTQPPNDSEPLKPRPAAAKQTIRDLPIKVRTTNDQQTSASMNPLAIALATSLASTLREQSRRDKERLPLNARMKVSV